MKLLDQPPFGVLDEMKYEVQNRLPNMAIPGLALTMDKILGKVSSGVYELSVDDKRIIYGQRDKGINEWSPDIRNMDLAELAEVRKRLTKEADDLKKRIQSDDEEKKRLQEIEKEAKLREKILKELNEKNASMPLDSPIK